MAATGYRTCGWLACADRYLWAGCYMGNLPVVTRERIGWLLALALLVTVSGTHLELQPPQCYDSCYPAYVAVFFGPVR